MNKHVEQQVASDLLAAADTLTAGKDTNIVLPLATLRAVSMSTNNAAVTAAEYLVDRGYAYYGKHEDELGLLFTRLGFAHIQKLRPQDPEFDSPS